MTADAGVPAASRAVLIGVSAYEYTEFPPIRAARNSLQAMRSLLSDPALGGWPADQITVIANPISATGLATDIADLAESTTGALLLYYVGHGMLSVRGELCLTVTSTHPERPKISGLPWDTAADVLRGCPANPRLAILDCCFAGQAIEALTGEGGPGLADIAHVEGVYTLTATTRNRAAHVPPPNQQDTACTSFTAELKDLIRCGIPGQAPRLTLSDIYPVLRQRLLARSLPAPSQRGTDAVGQVTFTANAAVSPGPHAQNIPASGIQGATQNDVAAQGDVAAQTAAGPEPVRPGPSRHAVVLTDALRAAQSITDEHSEARTVAIIARAVAATDPGRAARLIADAERIARAIPGPDRKASALASVVEALAGSDPDRAERVAQSITEPSFRAPALAAVASAVAATDADRAARLIAGAERIARAISGASLRAPALAAVATAQAAIDPARAARLVGDAERSAQLVPDVGRKAPALAAVAEALSAIDLDRAERVARSITDGSSQARALAAVAKALADREPAGR